MQYQIGSAAAGHVGKEIYRAAKVELRELGWLMQGQTQCHASPIWRLGEGVGARGIYPIGTHLPVCLSREYFMGLPISHMVDGLINGVGVNGYGIPGTHGGQRVSSV